MRIENSPKYEMEMTARLRKMEEERKAAEVEYEAEKAAWRANGSGWMPMGQCPFAALDNRYGFDGAVLVTDGKDTALATVKKRFGRPIFYKVQPEMVWRDGTPTLVGGEEDPRTDLPKWWWQWELTDEFGSMNYAGGEETGKDEVAFVPTHWTFLPEPPKGVTQRAKDGGSAPKSRDKTRR